MLAGYRCFKLTTTVCVSFDKTPTVAPPVSWRGPCISTLYFPGAICNNRGVRPTTRSLMKISAPSGTERKSTRPAFSPALSSKSFRFNSDGGGPVLARRCGEELCTAGVAIVVEGAFALCAATAELEVNVPDSAIACACDVTAPNPSNPRIAKALQSSRKDFSSTAKCLSWNLSEPLGARRT